MRFFLFAVLFFATACSLKPHDSNRVSLTLEIEGANPPPGLLLENPIQIHAAPSSTSGFNCLGVNVVGPGIPDTSPGGSRESVETILGRLFSGQSCAYAGVTSKPLPNQANTEVGLTVPAGPQRLVQVVGIKDNGSGMCSYDGPLASAPDGGSTATKSEIYELGRAVVDLFRDVSVGITNTFDALSSADKEKRSLKCGDSIDPNQVSGLLAWLKAESYLGVYGDNTTIGANWANYSTYSGAYGVFSPNAGPRFRTSSGPNSQPNIEIQSTDHFSYSGIPALSASTWFVVGKIANSASYKLFRVWESSVDYLRLYRNAAGELSITGNNGTNSQSISESSGSFHVFRLRTYLSGGQHCAGMKVDEQSEVVSCATGSGIPISASIVLGESAGSAFSEVLIYNWDLTATEDSARITRYLQAKYAL